jgi:hypothetical protein
MPACLGAGEYDNSGQKHDDASKRRIGATRDRPALARGGAGHKLPEVIMHIDHRQAWLRDVRVGHRQGGARRKFVEEEIRLQRGAILHRWQVFLSLE